MLVDDYADYRRPKRLKLEEGGAEDDSPCATTVASQLKLSDILSYAHRISYTTFAPPEFGAGQAPLRGALPPAPQEEQMRASQLYNFADLDVGLPKMESKEKQSSQSLNPHLHNWHPFFLRISQFHLVGNLGTLWNCQPIYLFFLQFPRLDGNLGTQYHWIQFLPLLGLSNNPALLPLKDCIRHLKPYKCSMFSWIFWIRMMIAVTIAAMREALRLMMIRVVMASSYRHNLNMKGVVSASL